MEQWAEEEVERELAEMTGSLVYLSPVNVECDPASQFMCADWAKCVDICFCCESNHFSYCALH